VTPWLLAICAGLGFTAYLFLVGTAIIGLIRLAHGTNTSSLPTDVELPTCSIIISARNEEANIGATLTALLAQDYPANRYDITVVDDRSEDNTAGVVQQLQGAKSRIALLRQAETNPLYSPKKQALERGIAESWGEIIVTTDADCQPQTNWLHTLVSGLSSADMAVGQARFALDDHSPLWQKLQALDFQAQTVLSAGLITADMPFNCSGASLAYKRSAYNKVNGWHGVRELISGDDELLMGKFVHAGLTVKAVIGSSAVVRTQPVGTLRELWHQRVRWGSKGLHYHPSRVVVLAGLFLFYLTLVLYPVLLIDPFLRLLVPVFFLAKMILDLLVLRYGVRLFDDSLNISHFLVMSFIHPLWIVSLAVAGQFGRFEWKGETYKSKGRVVAN